MAAKIMTCVAWVTVAMTCCSAAAVAAPVIDVGTIQIRPGTTKTFIINVAGGTSVQGMDLYMQLGDGGTVNGGTDTRPVIRNVDLLGSWSVFGANNSGQQNTFTSDLLWAVSTTTRTGTVNAGGRLAYVTIDAAGATAGQSYAMKFSGVAADIFGSPGVDTAFAGIAAQITNGRIDVTDGPLIPDFNNDGRVNVGDLSILGGSWSLSGKQWFEGDATGDGLVTVGDLALLGGCWGWTRPMSAPLQSVPEPATLLLLALGGPAILKRRKWRKSLTHLRPDVARHVPAERRET